VRSARAGGTAPDWEEVVTGRLGYRDVYVISSCHKYHSRAHDKTQAPHARRSRAFTAPKSTRRDSCRPYPGGSGHVGWRACPSASACRLLSGSGSRPACAGGGVLSPRSPRARVGDNTLTPVLSALASGSQVSRTKMPPKPLLEPRPDAAPIGYPKKPIDGSPLGGYAKRPPLIPSLNLNSAIVRTTIRSSAARRATYADPRRRPRSRDCRGVPRGRRKSINFSRALRERRMSDNTRLSGTAIWQAAGARQHNSHREIDLPVNPNFSTRLYAKGHEQWRSYRTHRAGTDQAVPSAWLQASLRVGRRG
jgi:hypothetical protein